jgi:hypothetical protein
MNTMWTRSRKPGHYGKTSSEQAGVTTRGTPLYIRLSLFCTLAVVLSKFTWTLILISILLKRSLILFI